MKKFYRTQRLLLLPAETSLAKGIAEYYLRNREFLRAFEPQRDESFFTEETQRELLIQEEESGWFSLLSGTRFTAGKDYRKDCT